MGKKRTYVEFVGFVIRSRRESRVRICHAVFHTVQRVKLRLRKAALTRCPEVLFNTSLFRPSGTELASIHRHYRPLAV